MAKGKKGKKKGKKKEKEINPNALSEVDKTFYELTITDLNRKLARLRTLNVELEDQNEEIQAQMKKQEEDRDDVVNYLRRSMDELTHQTKEYQDRIDALKEEKKDIIEKHEEKVKEMNKNYEMMHEELTSENKLLAGKINSLDEFRVQRESLMKKFEDQEQEFEAAAKRHKRELYDIERKFIVSKNRMKLDMEARLQQLSTDFQNTTELRISATTHKVIRENISINNELEVLLNNQKKLCTENENIRKRDTKIRLESELFQTERDKALSKVRIQAKVIESMVEQQNYLKSEISKFKHFEEEALAARQEIFKNQSEIDRLSYVCRVLEQNLHNVRCERTELLTKIDYYKSENIRLSDIIFEATSCIKEELALRQRELRATLGVRDNLLQSLFTLLNTVETHKTRVPSLESVDVVNATYELGDLGFIPKKVALRSQFPTKQTYETQTGQSLEDMIQDEVSKLYKESAKVSETTISKQSSEEKSSVFFNEEELPVEDEEDKMNLEAALEELSKEAEAKDSALLKIASKSIRTISNIAFVKESVIDQPKGESEEKNAEANKNDAVSEEQST